MLYLIGGAARAGKTILARRLLREHNVPCFCVDYFVSALFVGYARTTPERKLAEIRQFAGDINDWIQHHTDEYVLELAREMIEFSAYVRDECRTCGIPYVDLSDDFSGGIERAYRLLHT